MSCSLGQLHQLLMKKMPSNSNAIALVNLSRHSDRDAVSQADRKLDKNCWRPGEGDFTRRSGNGCDLDDFSHEVFSKNAMAVVESKTVARDHRTLCCGALMEGSISVSATTLSDVPDTFASNLAVPK